MTVDDPGTNPASLRGRRVAGHDVTVDAGTYSVTETGPSGYAASYSADCSGTIAIGQTKTCTVTNNDIAGEADVVKNVINNNGGTKAADDFPSRQRPRPLPSTPAPPVRPSRPSLPL